MNKDDYTSRDQNFKNLIINYQWQAIREAEAITFKYLSDGLYKAANAPSLIASARPAPYLP